MAKISPRDIDAFIRKPDPAMRAILVYGPDLGLVNERAIALCKTVTPNLDDAFSVVTLTESALADDPALLTDEASALSFGGGRRLIRIRESGEKIVPACKNFFASLNDDNDSLIVIEAGNLTPKSALRKLFETEKKAAALPCYNEEGANLINLLRTLATEQGLRADPDALHFIAEHVQGDRMVARSEISKIACYMMATPQTPQKLSLEDTILAAGLGGALSLNDINSAVAGGQHVMLDKYLLKAFAEGMNPVMLLRANINYFRRLHLAKSYVESGMNPAQAMKKLNPPVFFKEERAFTTQMQKWSLPKLEKALDMLNETEAQIKRTGMPAQTLCAQLLSRLAKATA